MVPTATGEEGQSVRKVRVPSDKFTDGVFAAVRWVDVKDEDTRLLSRQDAEVAVRLRCDPRRDDRRFDRRPIYPIVADGMFADSTWGIVLFAARTPCGAERPVTDENTPPFVDEG